MIGALISAGALQTLTLAPFNYWLFGPISIALALWSTQALVVADNNNHGTDSDNNTKNNTQAKPARYGWYFGLGLFSSGASWVYISIHTYGHASPPLAGLLTLVFVTGLALFHALLFALYFKFRSQNQALNGALFTAFWVLSDAFRTVFLTGFPWLFLGYGHLNSPLAGWIPIIGVYGISMIIVATGAVIALWTIPFQLTNTKLPVKLAITLLIAIAWIVGPTLNTIDWTKKREQTLSIALLQTNIPQELKWLPSQRRKTLKLLEDMTQENWGTDLIIWPETAVPMLFDQAKPLLDRMAKKASKHKANIISGIPYREYNKQTKATTLHNSVYSFGEGSGINHKQKLVPFGEYVPMQEVLRGLIAFFDLPMSDFRKGPSDQALLLSHGHQVAPFICYEVVYPDFVASRASEADYLLTISNDSWFGASIGPLQHLEMAQMRAAENGRFMVRATNNGISAIIDHKGQISAQTEQFVKTTLQSHIELYTGQTPFTKYGSSPVFIFSSLLVFLSLFRRRKAN